MSRIGKKPIALPPGASVEIREGSVVVTGKNGTLKRPLLDGIELEVKDGVLTVGRTGDDARSRSYHGLMRTLIANMVEGVDKGFEKKLEIVGIGYRAELGTDSVVFYLGYSHPISFALPAGIKAQVEKQNLVSIWGIDKEIVGETAAKMRALRKPDVYKNKGVKYAGEVLRKKAGKSGK
jgi:large subunit ribosomal protein L6